MKPNTFTPTERQAAARIWRDSGHLGLGLWLSRVRPRFGVKDYSEAVTAAREELGDFRDYSSADTGAHKEEGHAN